jgi:hypothetical protein
LVQILAQFPIVPTEPIFDSPQNNKQKISVGILIHIGKCRCLFSTWKSAEIQLFKF